MLRLFRYLPIAALLTFSQTDIVSAERLALSELNELSAIADLPPIDGGGDIVRYVIRRIPGYVGRSSATIVEAAYPYEPRSHPRVIMIELISGDRGWQVSRRREALMEPNRFSSLIKEVATAASSAGEQPPLRGQIVSCSHADTSHLSVSLPDRGNLRISRDAHCSDEAAADIAGGLLMASAEESFRLNWSPDPSFPVIRVPVNWDPTEPIRGK